MNPVRVIDHATMLPDPKKQRQVMQWLFTIVAPDGCPTCKNPTDGAWTCAQDFLTETYVLHCDECEWSERVTAEAIADFVMGRREDPREFDTCACGRRKRKLHKLCSECAEAAKWDVCACGVKKSVFQTQCPDCREAARWDACTCGVKKLKTEQVCSECKLAEVQFGTLVAIERGGLLECLKR